MASFDEESLAATLFRGAVCLHVRLRIDWFKSVQVVTSTQLPTPSVQVSRRAHVQKVHPDDAQLSRSNIDVPGLAQFDQERRLRRATLTLEGRLRTHHSRMLRTSAVAVVRCAYVAKQAHKELSGDGLSDSSGPVGDARRDELDARRGTRRVRLSATRHRQRNQTPRMVTSAYDAILGCTFGHCEALYRVGSF